MVRTKSVATSNATDIFPSIKEFHVKDSFDTPTVLKDFTNADDFDVWLITTPVKFPSSSLEDIQLVANSSTCRIKKEDGIAESYSCDSRSPDALSTSVIVQSRLEETIFNCKKINGHIRIKGNIEKLKPNLSHCIRRTSPPSISKNLHERLKLIGCDTVMSTKNPQQAGEIKLKRRHSSLKKKKDMKKKKKC